jgi:hypothetical protein
LEFGEERVLRKIEQKSRGGSRKERREGIRKKTNSEEKLFCEKR